MSQRKNPRREARAEVSSVAADIVAHFSPVVSPFVNGGRL